MFLPIMPSLPDHIQDLQSPSFDTRQIAASHLGDSRDARAVEPLFAALSDESWEIRASAVTGLGHLYVQSEEIRALGPNHIASRILPLITDEQYGLRIAVLKVLGWLGANDSPVVEAVFKALDDDNLSVRQHAIEAIGHLRDPRVVPRFIDLLSDMRQDPWTRKDVASALGNLGDALAVEPLIAALGDPFAPVRNATLNALCKLGDRRAVPPIRALLRDPDPHVRFWVIQAVAKFNDAESILILDAMAANDAAVGNGQPLRQVAAEAAKVLRKSHKIPSLRGSQSGVSGLLGAMGKLFGRRKRTPGSE